MPEKERPVIYITKIDDLLKEKVKERTTMTLRRDDMARLTAIESLVGVHNKRDVIVFLIQQFEDSLPDDLKVKYEQRFIMEMDKLLDSYDLSHEARQQFDELKLKYPKLLEQRKKMLGQTTKGIKKSEDGVPVSGKIEEVDNYDDLIEGDPTAIEPKVDISDNKDKKKKGDGPF